MDIPKGKKNNYVCVQQLNGLKQLNEEPHSWFDTVANEVGIHAGEPRWAQDLALRNQHN